MVWQARAGVGLVKERIFGGAVPRVREGHVLARLIEQISVRAWIKICAYMTFLRKWPQTRLDHHDSLALANEASDPVKVQMIRKRRAARKSGVFGLKS